VVGTSVAFLPCLFWRLFDIQISSFLVKQKHCLWTIRKQRKIPTFAHHSTTSVPQQHRLYWRRDADFCTLPRFAPSCANSEPARAPDPAPPALFEPPLLRGRDEPAAALREPVRVAPKPMLLSPPCRENCWDDSSSMVFAALENTNCWAATVLCSFPTSLNVRLRRLLPAAELPAPVVVELPCVLAVLPRSPKRRSPPPTTAENRPPERSVFPFCTTGTTQCQPFEANSANRGLFQFDAQQQRVKYSNRLAGLTTNAVDEPRKHHGVYIQLRTHLALSRGVARRRRQRHAHTVAALDLQLV
jgi:hypothetical protein